MCVVASSKATTHERGGNLRRRRDAPLSSSDVDATVQFRPKV